MQFYNVSTSPPSFIAPVLYMWRPFSNENNCVSSGENNAFMKSCNFVRQGCSTSSRQLWIWIHSAAFEEGLDILRRACQMQVLLSVDCKCIYHVFILNSNFSLQYMLCGLLIVLYLVLNSLMIYARSEN